MKPGTILAAPEIDPAQTWIETLHPLHDHARYRETLAFRQRHLREPLGLAFTDADIQSESTHLHLALRHRASLLGTLVLVPPDRQGIGKIRQMAITPGHRNRGLGTRLVRHAEDELRRLGATVVVLHARAEAVGFYVRLGYAAEGHIFIEVTIPHRRMSRRLEPAASLLRSCPTR